MIAVHFRRRHCVPLKETIFSFGDCSQGGKCITGESEEGRVFHDLTIIVHEGSLTRWHWKEPLIPRDLNGTGTKATMDA